MEGLIRFTEFLAPYGVYSYLGMFGVLLACGFGLPMPEDIILISGGILAARGVCDLWLTNVICLAGVLLGDGAIFMLGRHNGPRIKRTVLFRRIFKEKTEETVKEFFRKYGDKVIFMARFMPGLRMPIFLSSGIYHVSPWKFFLLDGFAAIISVPVWIYAGYVFGANLELLEQRIKQLQLGLYLILLCFVVLFAAYVIIKKRLMNRTSSSTSAASMNDR